MKSLFYTLIVIIITLIGAELILRVFLDLPDPYQSLRTRTYSTGSVIRLQNTPNSDVTFVFHPNELYPRDEKNIINIHINNFGFRHHENIDTTRNEFSIFAIGGSTTQGYDYPYDKTWCQILEKGLESHFKKPIRVYNGGTAGAAMFDHLALLQNRVIHLKPDMVILFAGVNDLNVLVGDNNRYRFENIYETVEYVSWYKLVLGKFTLYKLFHNASRKLRADEGSPLKTTSGDDDPGVPEGTPVQFADHVLPAQEAQKLPMGENPNLDFNYYRNMVISFIGTCMANNIPVMVMTQPTTWNTADTTLQKYHWMNKNKSRRFDKKFMQASMDRMNEDMASAAGERKIPCFRLEEFIPNNGQYFYDDCHFTPKGSVLAGELLKDYIVKNNLIPLQ